MKLFRTGSADVVTFSDYTLNHKKRDISFLPAALREAQTCRYLVYSEANFEVFRPAGATRCTDGGEIWHGGGDRRTPKIEIFTQI